MERKDLLHHIQKINFALVETNLYLNAYPDCEKALEYFNEMKSKYKTAVTQYESAYGSLTAGSTQADDWDWVRTPWPWELGVN